MARPAGEPLTRITLNLRSEDFDMLKRLHPNGYQLVIRDLVKEYIKTVNAEADTTLNTLNRMYPDA